MTSMVEFEDLGDGSEELESRPLDPQELAARDFLREFFEANPTGVFFSRQLEVQNERKYFHWITNRAIRHLEGLGVIRSEMRKLNSGTHIKIIWNKGNRYYRRSAARLVQLVEEYSAPVIGKALGLQGEFMVMEAFGRNQFVMQGRNTRSFGINTWDKTRHDIDFIFERD